MCTVFEETRTEGRAEEIIETGHEFGLSEEEILTSTSKEAWMYHCRKHRNILRCLVNRNLENEVLKELDK